MAAHADARYCRQLQSRLVALSGSAGTGSAEFRRYDRAVTRQRSELTTARKRARAAGCGFFLGGSAQCSGINVKIERMQANLTALERRRSALAGGARSPRSAEREREGLRAALRANRCSATQAESRSASNRAGDRGGNVFDRIFGGGSIEYVPTPDNVRRVTPDESRASYRTFCVRTCDGYFFPMSPSSSRDDFARDLQNCSSICPGANMQIYYHSSPDSDADQMMSAATDTPYGELASAHLYKREDVESPQGCGCGATVSTERGFSIVAGEKSAVDGQTDRAPFIPAPTARPDPAADPETLANAHGKFGAAEIKALLKPKMIKRAPEGERKVRVVGPAFLPDPRAAASPPAPDRKAIP